MRPSIRLDEANAAVVSLYFAPVWGIDAVRALHSPYLGFDSQTHAVAVGYYRVLLGLGPEGLVWVSHVLAGTKLLIAVGFLAYLVDVLRALVVRREADAATLDLTFALAGAAIVLGAWPALHSGNAALIRLHASELLLLCGAMLLVATAHEAGARGTGARGTGARGTGARCNGARRTGARRAGGDHGHDWCERDARAHRSRNARWT